MTNASFNINIEGNVFVAIKQLQANFNSLEESVKQIETNSKASFSSIANSISSIKIASVTQNLQNLSQGFQDINQPGLSFNQSLRELSALTGTSGRDLNKLGDLARSSAKEFGGSAAASLDSYKTILGRLGPDIAKNQEALAGMERNVQILSKTMGGDSAGAVDALTTAMLQYGVDLSNPIQTQKEMTKMMDVMANSAQEGAAEVPSISAALKVSGVAATQAKVSFAETNAAIQALAQGGKEGSEAGVALRNILGKMAGEDVLPKEAAEKLKKLGVDMRIVSDTSIPFTDRLRELKKAQGDATIMAQVFGTENAAAAQILLQSVDAQDKMTGEIIKTGGAQQQANIVMESTEEKLKRMRASIDNAKIGFFELTGGVTAYLSPISELLTTFSSLTPILNGVKTVTIALATAEGRAAIATKLKVVADRAALIASKAVTAAQWLWNVALNANPIGLVITAVAALGTALYAVSKAFKVSSAAERVNAELKDKMIDKTAEEESRLLALFTVLKKTNKGSEERKKVVSELNEKYPDLLKKYDLEKASLNEINRAYKDIAASIQKKAEAEALSEMLTEKTKEIKTRAKEGRSWYQDQTEYLIELAELKADRNQITKQLTDLQIKDIEKQTKGGNSVTPQTTTGAGTSGTDYKNQNNPIVSPAGTSDKKYSGTGGELKNINVRIENLVKELVIQTSNITESTGLIRDKITEAMVGAVRDFEVAM